MRISDWSSDVCSSDLHLGVQLTQPTAQILPHLRIECAERFVEQQQLGIDSKRASQSDTLTLAPGKLRGIAIGDLPELHQLQQFPRDRKSGVQGKSVSVRVDLVGRRILNKIKKTNNEG